MVVFSVSIPDELRKRMSNMEEINWSAVARNAFEQKVKEIEVVRNIVGKSKLTQKDADEIATKINKEIARRFKEMK